MTMLDLSHLPGSLGRLDAVFNANGGAWSSWSRPRGARMGLFYLIGSGSGGNGGTSGATGTGRTGGGSGGTGAILRFMIPLDFLPNTLYFNIPAAGAGGAPNSQAGAGALTYMAIAPSTAPENLICVSGNAAPTTSATLANAGGFGTAFTGANAYLSYLGMWTAIAGQSGVGGGASSGAAGSNSSVLATQKPFAGGGGGGSTNTSNSNFPGGDITGLGQIPTIAGGVSGGGNGAPGMALFRLLSSTGGSGGGSNGTGTGGNGGDSAIACGGGGGGAGVTGGSGGRGGEGIVLVYAW